MLTPTRQSASVSMGTEGEHITRHVQRDIERRNACELIPKMMSKLPYHHEAGPEQLGRERANKRDRRAKRKRETYRGNEREKKRKKREKRLWPPRRNPPPKKDISPKNRTKFRKIGDQRALMRGLYMVREWITVAGWRCQYLLDKSDEPALVRRARDRGAVQPCSTRVGPGWACHSDCKHHSPISIR